VASGYNDRGTFTKRGVAARRARADEMNHAAMDDLTNGLIRGGSSRALARAKLSCACPHCSGREPWARMNFTLLTNVLLFALIAMPFIFYFSDRSVTLPLMAAALIARLTLYLLRMKQISRLMQTTPPLFDVTLEGLAEQASRHSCYAGLDLTAMASGPVMNR
ncbi:MAG: hypothetical protein ACI4MK_13575, partial [Aristaeellaceae bacterium]